MVRKTAVPINPDTKNAKDVEYAKKKKIMLDVNPNLLIFKKE